MIRNYIEGAQDLMVEMRGHQMDPRLNPRNTPWPVTIFCITSKFSHVNNAVQS